MASRIESQSLQVTRQLSMIRSTVSIDEQPLYRKLAKCKTIGHGKKRSFLKAQIKSQANRSLLSSTILIIVSKDTKQDL